VKVKNPRVEEKAAPRENKKKMEAGSKAGREKEEGKSSLGGGKIR